MTPLPVPPNSFPIGLGLVTAIAARLQIFKMQPQIRPLVNPDLMVSVQMPAASSECQTQFIEHLLRRWNSKTELAKHPDGLRLPPAINATPAIPLETKNAEPTVIRVVSAVGARSAARILFLSMRITVPARSEFGASECRAWTLWNVRHSCPFEGPS